MRDHIFFEHKLVKYIVLASRSIVKLNRYWWIFVLDGIRCWQIFQGEGYFVKHLAEGAIREIYCKGCIISEVAYFNYVFSVDDKAVLNVEIFLLLALDLLMHKLKVRVFEKVSEVHDSID